MVFDIKKKIKHKIFKVYSIPTKVPMVKVVLTYLHALFCLAPPC